MASEAGRRQALEDFPRNRMQGCIMEVDVCSKPPSLCEGTGSLAVPFSSPRQFPHQAPLHEVPMSLPTIPCQGRGLPVPFWEDPCPAPVARCAGTKPRFREPPPALTHDTSGVCR